MVEEKAKEALMSPLAYVVLTALATIIGGFVLYHWLIPGVEKFRKARREKKLKRKNDKLASLNRKWKDEKRILCDLLQPLREFNVMDSRDYRAPKCIELARKIEEEALKIESLEFKGIKEKLLEYAGRRNKINQDTPRGELKTIFLKPVAPFLFEPLSLGREIDKILAGAKTPPYSEKDL